MLTLIELKSKWFIPINDSAKLGVPCRRHTDLTGTNALNVSTDDNVVIPLIDGKLYMQRWHDQVLSLHNASDSEVFHAGWRFEAVKTLGSTTISTTALEDLNNAHVAGVNTMTMLCGNAVVGRFNSSSVEWLRSRSVLTSCLDERFPPAGSNHQKFAVFKSATAASAILGSIDISKSRWDTPLHLPVDPDRDSQYGKQTHDTGVAIQGLAVGDIEKTYRERWNDSSRWFGLEPCPLPLISSPVAAFPGDGTCSVQVLRTYGITSTFFGYSWSPRGEFTVWASYLNAIKRASTYIYIEDQYFLPFDWPPCHTRTGLARDTDIIYQLGEAIKRGVIVVVVTPSNAEDSTHMYQKYQRDIGVNYLQSVKVAGAPGDVVVSSLQSGGSDVYVHSKLMIVDDEFVLIGSTNIGQRSMTYDGELHVGIIDRDNIFAKAFRVALWAEHTSRSAAELDDPAVACVQFKADVAARVGMVKPYPVDPLAVYPRVSGSTRPPIGHSRIIRSGIDPYAGPQTLR